MTQAARADCDKAGNCHQEKRVPPVPCETVLTDAGDDAGQGVLHAQHSVRCAAHSGSSAALAPLAKRASKGKERT